MKVAFGDFHRVHCTGAADMLAQWEQRDGKPVLFTTDYLEESLAEVLLNADVPVVVVLDTAKTAIATAAELRSMSFLECIRHTSLYIASLHPVLHYKNSMIFGSEFLDLTYNDFIVPFLAALNLNCDSSQLLRLMQGEQLRRFADRDISIRQLVEISRKTIRYQDVTVNWTDSEIDAFEIMAENFQVSLDANSAKHFNCPLNLLHSNSDDFKIVAPINLIGPARLLIWGPYLYLTKSDWVVTMEFEVSESFSLNSITADILLGGVIANIGEFDLPTRGVFTWSMNFSIVDFSKSVEVRLLLTRSAIEGKLALRNVQFSRQT